MKRLLLFTLTALLLLPLFCSCVMTGEDETLTARIIRIYPDADAILLAPMGMSEGQPPLFLHWEWHEELTEGDCMVLTYRGGLIEEKSAFLNAPLYRPKKTVSVTTDVKRFDNLASVYLQTLIDHVIENAGFGNPSMLSVDLSKTSLPENERTAFRLAIEEITGTVPLSLSVTELEEAGYLVKDPILEWEEGYVLSVIEAEEKSSGTKKFFRVGRWRSGRYSTSWIDNITECDENGVWSPYVKGRLRQT
ncbi:MAG: hypothetical protein E7604_08935 [Ruminococcaceae bacterium]|nr:hypothetical protein [Oscillospiraceae bacterium]